MTPDGLPLERGNGKSKSLYQQLRHQLQTEIQSGRWRCGERLPSISKLMAEWKLDYRTVVSALKLLEQDRFIRCEEGRGMGPLVVWRKAAERKAKILFAKWCSNGQFVRTVSGVVRYAEEKNLDCSIVDAKQDHNNVLDVIRNAPLDVDGLLLYPWDNPEYRAAITTAVAAGLQVVFLDRNLPGMSVPAVTPDNFGGAYRATKHLLEAQGLPVYYFGLTGTHSSRIDRFHGWVEAMREHDHEDISYLCELKGSEYEVSFSRREEVFQLNCDVARGLLAKAPSERISVFCYNGLSVRPIYLAAEERGLQIGRDVFVAGFMPAAFGDHLAVSLTRVIQNDELVGYEAARMLHQKITGEVKDPLDRILPINLEIRASSTGREEADKKRTPLDSEPHQRRKAVGSHP
jgi:GntR family transcriptional regulator, arabinose operon transcriptional repressor